VALRHRFGAEGFALDVACAAPAQGFTAQFGPSARCKSTMLSAIAGLLRPDGLALRPGLKEGAAAASCQGWRPGSC